jgi:hypothetical protein
MSNLVFDLDGFHTAADGVLINSGVVERDRGPGFGTAMGGMRGALWGTLVGLLFLNPLAGMAIGGITRAGARVVLSKGG